MVDNIEEPETDEPLESGLYWAAKDKIQRKVNFSNWNKTWNKNLELYQLTVIKI